MSKIKRATEGVPTYSVGLNVVASGTKQMSNQEQDTFMINEPEYIRILICDSRDKERVLVDISTSLFLFTTNNVGYKYHTKGLQFRNVSEKGESK